MVNYSLEMMGGQSSKNRSGGGDVSCPPLPINVDSHYAAALSSYEAECENNPDLKSFDVRVQERTNRALNSLATGVEVGSLSFDALMEITEFSLEMNEDAVKIILENKEDVWSNKELFELVKAFFDNSLKTLDFCAALESSLRRTRDSQLIIKLAVKQFESAENGGDERYVKTFEGLKRFQEAGDPFAEEFVQLFMSLYKQHLSMFKKLRDQKRKLDKKYSTMKTWKKVSNVILITAFASVLIFSVVAAAMSAPPVVIALAAALAVPMGPVGKWCNTLWNRYLKTIKEEKQLISSVEGRTYIILKDFENIRVLVRKLSIQLGSLVQNANLGISEQGAMQLVIDEIKKNLEGFDDTIDKLSVQAAKCSTDVTKARTVILEKIAKHPNS